MLTRVDPGADEEGIQGVCDELDALGHGSRDNCGRGDGELRGRNAASKRAPGYQHHIVMNPFCYHPIAAGV